MASVIIDGRNADFTRVSISLDEFLWRLVSADFASEADARRWVREYISTLHATKGLTAIVRDHCLHRIVKPSLIRRVQGLEGQMDIEEA
ncbi:hypothetical protein [Microbulbifer yueqingensis]|uniref:Uncharacterized protein n=1 Tax=Microbulbifer yueqingensis TaxID=658219 RepID=A0A1G8ZRP8_9GAMM|nr:hypothetical protein [Microbulbifer yueqingensis]SDK17727.1 hypothetical protein SAMN05216212_1729 [Microbulbifer yueqingensis]